MSYDINIMRHDGTAVRLRKRHNCAGGTYALGGTREAWLNVTYNYSAIFDRLLGEDGIRTIYGMNIKQARPILEAAIAKLGDAKPDADYWKACDGNAKRHCRTWLSSRIWQLPTILMMKCCGMAIERDHVA